MRAGVGVYIRPVGDRWDSEGDGEMGDIVKERGRLDEERDFGAKHHSQSANELSNHCWG